MKITLRQKVLALLFSLTATFGIPEAYFRWTHFKPEFLKDHQYEIFVPDKECNFVLARDLRKAPWATNTEKGRLPYHVTFLTTNHRRFREFDETTPRVNPNEKMVLSIGDSVAMGYGIDQDKTYAENLERHLGYQVINAGVCAYGTTQEMRWMNRNLDLNPTLVLFQADCNDPMNDFWFSQNVYDLALDDNLLQSGQDNTFARRITKYGYRHSNLFLFMGDRYLSYRKKAISREVVIKPFNEILDDYIVSLLAAGEICRNKGIDFKVLLSPCRQELQTGQPMPYYSRTIQELQNKGISYIDGLAELLRYAQEKNIPPESLIISDSAEDAHLTTQGHSAIALGCARGNLQ